MGKINDFAFTKKVICCIITIGKSPCCAYLKGDKNMVQKVDTKNWCPAIYAGVNLGTKPPKPVNTGFCPI